MIGYHLDDHELEQVCNGLKTNIGVKTLNFPRKILCTYNQMSDSIQQGLSTSQTSWPKTAQLPIWI
jgi:hypothetical protein